MDVAHLGHVRGVDHHFAPVGHGRLHLVHALRRHPEVVVHRGHDREDALHRRGRARPRGAARRGRPPPTRPRGRGRRRDRRRPRACTTGARSDSGRSRSARGPVDHGAHRRRLGADHLVVRDEGAEPVGEVDDLGPGDAREEVLRPAREADHLVREDRPADEDVVVLEGQPVEGHRHVAAQPAAGQLLDLGRRDRPERREARRVVPAVVEDPARAGAAAAPPRARRAARAARRSSARGCRGPPGSRAPPRAGRPPRRARRRAAASASCACRRGSAPARAGRRAAAGPAPRGRWPATSAGPAGKPAVETAADDGVRSRISTSGHVHALFQDLTAREGPQVPDEVALEVVGVGLGVRAQEARRDGP